jgi:hypothetical protein
LTGDPDGENESEGAGEDQKRFGEYAMGRVGSPYGDLLERHVPRENAFERSQGEGLGKGMCFEMLDLSM